MSVEDWRVFQSAEHCHICHETLGLRNRIPVIFHNLRGSWSCIGV